MTRNSQMKKFLRGKVYIKKLLRASFTIYGKLKSRMEKRNDVELFIVVKGCMFSDFLTRRTQRVETSFSHT